MACGKITKSQAKVSCVCKVNCCLIHPMNTLHWHHTVPRPLKTLAALQFVKSFVVLTKKKPINMCINVPLFWKSIGYPWVFLAKWSNKACWYHGEIIILFTSNNTSLIARFMGPTWCPSGADRTDVGPMLAPWNLLSGICMEECIDLKLSLVLTKIQRQTVYIYIPYGVSNSHCMFVSST